MPSRKRRLFGKQNSGQGASADFADDFEISPALAFGWDAFGQFVEVGSRVRFVFGFDNRGPTYRGHVVFAGEWPTGKRKETRAGTCRALENQKPTKR